MKLYVLRHGKSPQMEEAGVHRDEDRPLAEEGREAVRRMAAYIKESGGNPSKVYTSPLVRARDTAIEAANVLKTSAPEETRLLANVLPAPDLFKGLAPLISREAEAMIVGHQPQLGDLVAYLSGESRDIKPGGCVALELTPERVKIAWAKNPKDLA